MDKKENKIIFFKSVSLIDKYNFYEYISIMLDGGVSFSETLKSVESKITSPYFKEKIKELSIYIESGDSFSKSMKKIQDVFTSFECSIVEAGEASGKLSFSFMEISNDFKKIHFLKNKIKSALTYPIIIFLFLFLAFNIVLIFVVPAIEPLFETTELELPLSTQLLISTSNFIINNFTLLLFTLIGFILFIVWYKNTINGKKTIEEFLFELPLSGKVYKNYILSNIASSLGNLIGSGVNIIKALNLIGKSVNNSVYKSLLQKIIIKITAGEKFVDAMSQVDKQNLYFPADYLQMLSVGERTGNIDMISKKISIQYEKEVDNSLSNLVKFIEPIAIIIASAFVLWFAFSILGAILKVTESVS